MYQDSEDLLGKWFQANPEKRDHIFLATKFANCVNPEDGSRYVDSSPEYARRACEKSLKRLGVERIDLCECFTIHFYLLPLYVMGIMSADLGLMVKTTPIVSTAKLPWRKPSPN